MEPDVQYSPSLDPILSQLNPIRLNINVASTLKVLQVVSFPHSLCRSPSIIGAIK